MTRDDRLRIAVFIDFDNIEIGVKNTLGANFDAGLVLEALKERGDVVSKTAYSDWQRAGGYSRSLTQHAIKMVQRNLTPGGDKNGADINLALDALEMAFTHPHINAFVIVGGDSDFISLVEKLKQYDKKVFVVGGRQFSSIIMQKNCHEFIAYENLVGATASASGGGDRRQRGGRDVRVERQPIEQALPLVTRALKVLSEREVSPQLGLLKSTLLQLDSTFSERSYGAGSFRDFVEKLEKVGVVKLQQGKGGWLVSATEEAEAAAAAAAAEAAAAAPGGPVTDDGDPADEALPGAAPQGGERRGHDHGDRGERGGDRGGDRHDRGEGGHQGAAPAVVGSNADGIREFRKILATGQVRRWPMYLRNVKQVIRQVSTTFDERAYGFANLADLLRAAGREGIVRVDRDRQGVIRVFQGSSMPTMAEAQAPMRDKAIFDIEDELAAEAANAANGAGQGNSVVVDETVIVVDENAGTVSEYVVATHPAVSPADDGDDEESNGEVEEEEDDSQLVMLAKASAKSHAKAPPARSRRPARGAKPAAAKEVRARAPRKRR